MKNCHFFLLAAVVVVAAGCVKEPPPVVVRPLPGACSLDVPAAGAGVSKAQAVRIEGWAFNTLSQTVPKEVEIIFTTQDGRTSKSVKAERDLKRPDVASIFKNPTLEAAGYSVDVTLGDLPEGTYSVAVAQKDENRILFCQTPSVVQVVN
ncbi:Ig-like domain-containing protein [Azoarcus sp. DN11]|uniref:Ig-like domain-containing protein n=1 Tax=Azoarcus sp. DN11 TaxID=356837 RepID=UPI000EB4BD61|nr:Ig-like domain-containing protein [Azoarcus sp. DN11]AYH45332.1 hypothetical protein CDA09_18435 [Azoarcus sp. DN11]